jgi:Uma2 family endonuclease
MAAAEVIHYLPFEAWLGVESGDRTGARTEWVGGRVYVVAGGTERHDLAAGLLYERLAPAARAAGCRPFLANRLLRCAHAAYYPDVLVVCGSAANRLYEGDARVVVEVLPRSTEDVDRREKAAAYAGLPGVEVYVLVDPDRPHVEVARPAPGGGLRWSAHGSGDTVDLGIAVIDIDELYAELNRTATT